MVTHENYELLELDRLRLDGGTQPRAAMSDELVHEYALVLLETPNAFPPLTVYHDGRQYWLADGFHRVAAARQCGYQRLRAEVRQGTRREAVLHSVGANATHGLRRSNADKRRAVVTLLEDPEWGQWSDRRIAARAQVSDRMVGQVRAELSATAGSPRSGANGAQMDAGPEVRRVARGGQEYTMQVGAIGDRRESPEWDERPSSPAPEPPAPRRPGPGKWWLMGEPEDPAAAAELDAGVLAIEEERRAARQAEAGAAGLPAKCRRCGRPLTSPESIAAGIGPECAGAGGQVGGGLLVVGSTPAAAGRSADSSEVPAPPAAHDVRIDDPEALLHLVWTACEGARWLERDGHDRLGNELRLAAERVEGLLFLAGVTAEVAP